MLDITQTTAYLQRLQLTDLPADPLARLQVLHNAHLQTIPFENLDITFGMPLSLETNALLDKLLHRQRGGFCYELNLAFALLLQTLGYRVEFLSARVFRGQPAQPGAEFDHLLLRVWIDEVPYLADVGFGECFRDPICLQPDRQQPSDPHWQCKPLTEARDNWQLLHQRPDGWHPIYQFSQTSWQLSAFLGMLHYHQTSFDSVFRQKTLVSRATSDGRITLADRMLIHTTDQGRTLKAVRDPGRYRELLVEHFGIALPAHYPVEAWWHQTVFSS